MCDAKEKKLNRKRAFESNVQETERRKKIMIKLQLVANAHYSLFFLSFF